MKPPKLPVPLNYGTFDVEPFADYMDRWPQLYASIPTAVIETWIYRHWHQFELWLSLDPLSWEYDLTTMTNDEISSISHVRDWPKVLRDWGDDLFDGRSRKSTWLGQHMLENGTTPAPIIVARDAAAWTHPREGVKMTCPLQLIEGHMRLAYLQAMIQRKHKSLRSSHSVIVARLHSNHYVMQD